MSTHNEWTWGDEAHATNSDVEESIANYLVGELDNRKLDTVVAPDGTEYHIEIRATLVQCGGRAEHALSFVAPLSDPHRRTP